MIDFKRQKKVEITSKLSMAKNFNEMANNAYLLIYNLECIL